MTATITYQSLAIVICISMLLHNIIAAAASTSQSSSSNGEATWVWFFFREDCFKAFFEKYDFSSQECIKLTLSKGIGYAIIAGSFILKVPQIAKILKAGSVEGISRSLFYLETLTLL